MLSAESNQAGSLGAGYRAVPLQRLAETTPLRVCLVVQESAEPVGGPFILLRDLADASVYLGCVTDAAGSVREWIEIWVQNLENLRGLFPAWRQAVSNHKLDESWTRRAEVYRTLDRGSVISSGWESANPRPIFFDLRLSGPVAPADKESGVAWELCRDDALLKGRELPEYSHSLSRYLHLPDRGETSPFLPVAGESVENTATQPLSQALGNLIPFNPGGGLMMLTAHAPLSFDEWIDVLSGAAWKGVKHGKKAFKPGGVYRKLQEVSAIQHGVGHLFLANQGRAGRMAETFHLKLHLFTSALRQVRAHVQAQQLPLLNLSAESFRIELTETDAALPFLWNFRTTLVRPGEAVALPVESTDARYFLPAQFGETSIYRPATSLPIDGRGSVRIRKVIGSIGDDVSLEGTLATQERIAISGSDLLWLRVTLPSGRIDLYAHLDASEAAAPGEVRFRTLPQRLSEAAVTALHQAEGVALAGVPFETLPLLSTPCDLYALGVLAVRTLLVDEETPLPIALDEILSLGQQAFAEDPAIPLADRLASLLAADPKRAALLSPARLLQEKITHEEAARFLPTELWTQTLALIIRTFPGLGPESFCRDYGDAPPLALETVFNDPLATLEQLILRSRSLIVIDWNSNREISSVIRQMMTRYGGDPAR